MPTNDVMDHSRTITGTSWSSGGTPGESLYTPPNLHIRAGSNSNSSTCSFVKAQLWTRKSLCCPFSTGKHPFPAGSTCTRSTHQLRVALISPSVPRIPTGSRGSPFRNAPAMTCPRTPAQLIPCASRQYEYLPQSSPRSQRSSQSPGMRTGRAPSARPARQSTYTASSPLRKPKRRRVSRVGRPYPAYVEHPHSREGVRPGPVARALPLTCQTSQAKERRQGRMNGQTASSSRRDPTW